MTPEDLTAAVALASGTVTPEAEGAAGDGVTNDNAAIRRAAEAAVAFGATLVLTAPVYHTGGSPLTFPAGSRARGTSTIVGGSPGASAVNLNGNTVIEGITVRNPSNSYSFAVNVLPGSDDVTLIRCKFPAARGVGVYLNSAGISNVLVERCTFDGLNYGVLSNSGMGGNPLSGAHDLHDVTVTGCVFTNISGDGVEINHPFEGSATGTTGAAHTFTIVGNTVHADVGSGRTAGLGIGVAGASNVKIVGNTITARNEGVHVEDDARDITIRDNTILEVTGPDAYAGIHILGSCTNVKIADNTVRNVTGPRVASGIIAGYDSRPVHSTHVTISGNHVENSGRDGITISASNGGNMRVHNNTVLNVDRDGVLVAGGMRDGFHVHDNTITGAGGYGVRVATVGALGNPHTIRDNTIVGAAQGEYLPKR